MTSERDPQPGLQRGAPCPALRPQVAGADSVWVSPRSRVSSHSPGESRLGPAATHLQAATWNRPARAVPGAPQLQLHQRQASTPGTPRLLNSTQVSSGASSEAGGASRAEGTRGRQVSRGPQHPAAHARPRTHLSAGTRGGGGGGLGRKKTGGSGTTPKTLKCGNLQRPAERHFLKHFLLWRHGSRGSPPALKGAAGGSGPGQRWCPQAAAPPGRYPGGASRSGGSGVDACGF